MLSSNAVGPRPTVMADVDNKLHDLIKTIAKQQHYDHSKLTIKPVESDGRNYTTKVHLITLENDGKLLELFAKVASTSEQIREAMNATFMYETEAFVYTKLAKSYEKLQEEAKISPQQRFVFPKFYGCNEKLYEETIVLDNLVAQGYESYDRFKSLDWEHASSAVVTLARFHALSFAYEQTNQDDFQEIIKKYVYVQKEISEGTMKVWEGMMRRTLEAVREDQRGRIMNFFETQQKLLKDGSVFEKFTRPIGRAVLTHADFRPCNMMFKTQENAIHTIPVDYQTVRSGSPTNDLVYLLAIGTDAQFRRDHYHRLVDLYYSNLEQRMRELGVNPQEVYDRNTFDNELKQMLPYALLVGIAVLPMVLVEMSQVPNINGDSDLASFVVASSDTYSQRMTELVDDLIQWGAI